MEPLNVKQEEGESRIDYSVRVYTELGLPVLHHPSGYLKYTIVAPGEYEHVVHNGGLYHRLKDQVDFYSLVVAPEGTRLDDPLDDNTMSVVGFDTATPQLVADFGRGDL